MRVSRRAGAERSRKLARRLSRRRAQAPVADAEYYAVCAYDDAHPITATHGLPDPDAHPRAFAATAYARAAAHAFTNACADPGAL